MTAPADADLEASPRTSPSATAAPLGPLGEVLLVARYEILAMLGSARALFFAAVYLTLTLSVGGGYVWTVAKIRGQIDAKLDEMGPDAKAALDEKELRGKLVDELVPIAEKLGGQPLADALRDDELPWVMLAVLLLSSFALPGLVLLIGFDRISEELGSRYARFVLQRVRRGSWLMGKMLGHWASALGAMILVHLVLLIFAATQDTLEVGAIARALPRIWLAAAVFLTAYVAFTALVSATISPPFACLALGTVVLAALWFWSLSDLGRKIWIGTWDVRLWVGDPEAAARFLITAAVFGGLAWARVRTREV